MDNMTEHDSNQMADTRHLLATNKFPLLRQLSITSLVAMLITAAILVFLYRQDQLTEHNEITAQDNEKAAIHLMRLLDDQINTLVTTGNGFDAQALRTNPNIGLFTAALEMVLEHDILKLKIYNLSGTTIYSSAKDEIGGTSDNPDWLAKALRGEVVHHIGHRDTFLSKAGEMHDAYVASVYMPLTHAGKRIGVFEIYADATPVFNRIHANTIRIALIVFCAFTALYVTLFFYVRRTDRAVAEWQKRITKSEKRYQSLFENMFGGFASCKMQHDDRGRPVDFVYLNVNKAFGRMTGLKDVVGKTVSKVIPGIREQHPELFDIYDRVASTGIPEVFDIDLKLIGKQFTVSAYSPEPGDGYFVVVFEDITERKQAEESLRESEIRFREIFNTVSDAIFIHDAETGRIIDVNHRMHELYGLTHEEALACGPDDLSAGTPPYSSAEAIEKIHLARTEGPQTFDWLARARDGHLFWVEVSLQFALIGSQQRILAVVRDISERKQAEEKIYQLAFYDLLTGLPNRRLLNDRLGQTLAASKRSDRHGALMFMDLDNFKPLNDTYGHGVGDLLLIEVARRISSCVREVDTVARFGGDEFVVILSELDADKTESLAQASIVAEKIRAILAEPYVLTIQQEGKAETITVEHHCTSSIGVVLFINHEASSEDILKWADMAMYQAKEAGGNLIRFFDS